MKKINFTLVLVMLLGSAISGQTSPKEKGLESITMDAIRGQLEFLSSDWMEGRATGDKGFFMAADYVASMFRVFGVAPAGDAGFRGRSGMNFRSYGGRGGQDRSAPQRSYFQDFSLIETLPGGTASMTVKKGNNEYVFNENVDFSLGRISLSTKFDAPVVFAESAE